MISFATNPAFTPDLPAHSFQAPTLIGCQIFKEQGNAQFVPNMPTFWLNTIHLAANYNLLLIISVLFPTAEKRDYEGVFIPCQTNSGARSYF